ncbi:GerAB/ArcD/ProY family transporter [Niallia sp. NCCP-28]|uniref:GerAB/ArcD/ProY family transporter n=1 Tax=Niallia sp. NCCP-28 TaxID=2934712 RepID=UPI0020891D62|nr:GerAB/ArcD/ProY family transporter [Niallia sp. NCCP-28]GKU84450.1 spore germination protein KB [Niallia sp. NCCP-28]
MSKENISLSQLAALLFNFQIGSSVVIGLGLNAKEDAWIVIVISMMIGVFIAAFYYYIAISLPGKNLYEIFEYCFNRKIAIILTLLYACYFIYYACRIIRDFGELIATAVLPFTPIEVTILLLVLLMGYILYLGIEVLARTSEIFTPYGVILTLLLFIFLYVNKNIDISNIKPILGEGMKPVWKTIFPYELVRPYGQILVFLCVFCNVSNIQIGRRVVIFSIFMGSMLLLMSSLLIILSLGEDIALRSNFPLLSAARLVSIGEFIQRIDAIAIFSMMLGSLVKSCVYIYAGIKGLEYVFKLPFRYFSIPISCIVAMFSIFIGRNYTGHLQEGLLSNPFLLHVPLQFIFPVLLVCVMLLKMWKSKKKYSSPLTKKNM